MNYLSEMPERRLKPAKTMLKPIFACDLGPSAILYMVGLELKTMGKCCVLVFFLWVKRG